MTGDTCSSIEAAYGITFATFYAWNPAIGSDCTNLWLGEAYCVAISGSSASTTTTVISTTSSLTPPGPTQSGITSACTEYYLTVSGKSRFAHVVLIRLVTDFEKQVIRALQLKQHMISRLLSFMPGIQQLEVTARIFGLVKLTVSLYRSPK